MDLELRPRLNLITGDNGLGKSFLLDVAWWALTRRWPQDLNGKLASGYCARPTDLAQSASIGFEVVGKSGKVASYQSKYVAQEQSWLGKAGRPWNPGLVVYALADGGFAVWDPARNYWKKKGNIDVQERLPAYVFSPNDVWDGLRVDIDGKPTLVSKGLIDDWGRWIVEGRADAKRMEKALAHLAPTGGGGNLQPGAEFARLSVDDSRDIPTIHTEYGRDVPILHASLGVRRIAALAYMLSWAWREHLLAAKQLAQPPAKRIVLLFDEIEAHLHPRWQRSIVPALLDVVETLTGDVGASVQLIAATHSPLVLASLEPLFDPEQDAWFDLDLEDEGVRLTKRPYVPHGEVGNWLTSEAFDLGEPRSLEGERALRAARELMHTTHPTLTDVEAADQKLRAAGLPDLDPFWVRWGYFVEQIRNMRESQGAP